MCKDYKFKDAGQGRRKPFAELRRIGKRKRVTRHEIPEDE